MKRTSSIAALILIVAAFCARAAVVDRVVDPGTVIREKATPATQPVVVHRFQEGDAPYLLELPGGDDIRFTVRGPATRPATKPSDPPDYASGKKVRRLTSGLGGVTLQGDTYFGPSNGTRATLRGGVDVPGGTRNVVVHNIDFVGDGTREGIYAVSDAGSRDITFVGCSFTGFKAGMTVQARNHGAGVVHRNWAFVDCRILDTAGKGDKTGHGGYVDNAYGFKFERCVIDNIGLADGARKIWVHGQYIQAGVGGVEFDTCIVANCESVGVQARGPLRKASDPDDGKDPGPVIRNSVFIDNVIAIMVNGPRATLEGNLMVVGPHHNGPGSEDSGEGGIYASVGKLVARDNLVVRGVNVGKGYRIEAIRQGPRPQKDTEADGKTLKRWEWNAKTTTEGTNNRAMLDVAVDLSGLLRQARESGSDVNAIVLEMQKATRKAAGI